MLLVVLLANEADFSHVNTQQIRTEGCDTRTNEVRDEVLYLMKQSL